jgi:hypothetical protein
MIVVTMIAAKTAPPITNPNQNPANTIDDKK